MRIDSHQHFWEYDPVRDTWINDTMGAIRKDFLPQHLKPILDTNNIHGCIAVQADQSETETNFLLTLAKNNTFIKGVVGWVDLRAENIEEQLAHFSKNKKLKGLRHVMQVEADNFMLRKEFQNGISKLAQFDLTYDILVFPPQLKSVIELVKKFPNQPFVVDHLAKPYIKNGKIKEWKNTIQVLAKHPNVYCKVSGMVTEAHLKHWKPSDFTSYLDVIFNAFGVDRIMYGSDWPVCLLAANYKEQLHIIEEFITSFSDSEKEKIMGRNAVEFYNVSR